MVNRGMIYAMIDEKKTGVHEASVATRKITKDGNIVAQDVESVLNSSGFRPGMLPLKSMKMQWTLNEFIALDSQFEYKVSAQKDSVCSKTSLESGVINDFQSYMRNFDFRVMRVGYLYGYFLENNVVKVEAIYEYLGHLFHHRRRREQPGDGGCGSGVAGHAEGRLGFRSPSARRRGYLLGVGAGQEGWTMNSLLVNFPLLFFRPNFLGLKVALCRLVLLALLLLIRTTANTSVNNSSMDLLNSTMRAARLNDFSAGLNISAPQKEEPWTAKEISSIRPILVNVTNSSVQVGNDSRAMESVCRDVNGHPLKFCPTCRAGLAASAYSVMRLDGAGQSTMSIFVAMHFAARHGLNYVGVCGLRDYPSREDNRFTEHELENKKNHHDDGQRGVLILDPDIIQSPVGKCRKWMSEKEIVESLTCGNNDSCTRVVEYILPHGSYHTVMKGNEVQFFDEVLEPLLFVDQLIKIRERSEGMIASSFLGPLLYPNSSEPALRVAMHVRRGDVLAEHPRHVSDALWSQLVNVIKAVAPKAQIHGYSSLELNTTRADFNFLTSQGVIMHYNEEEDVLLTFAQLVTADVLVMSPSSFSHVGGVLNQHGCIIQAKSYIIRPMKSWILVENDAFEDQDSIARCVRLAADKKHSIVLDIIEKDI